MNLYKLTDENDQTRGGCQWGPGVCVETSGDGMLCSPAWTHWYTHPLLAVLLNPIHGGYNLDTAHLWEGHDGGGRIKSDHGLKIGCTWGTTIRRIDLPTVSIEQRVRFGIGAAWQVCPDPAWRKWAIDWLTGKDRSADAADAARAAAWAARAAAWAAEAARAADIDLIALARWAITDSVDVPELTVKG